MKQLDLIEAVQSVYESDIDSHLSNSDLYSELPIDATTCRSMGSSQ